MTRSAEALARRAAKRNLTVEQQRVKDGEERRKKKRKPNDDSRLQERGAWRCPACGHRNFASRRTCRSTTCSEKQPSQQSKGQSKVVVRKEQRQLDDNVVKQRQLRRQERQAASWQIPQADTETLVTNQQLRQRYLANDPQLTLDEKERAKVLIARDERKRLKKQQRQKGTKPDQP